MRWWLIALATIVSACEPAEEPPREVGEPCESHAQCVTELCLGASASRVCAAPCADEDACAGAGTCRLHVVARDEVETVEGACVPVSGGARGLLFDPCAGDTECRTGICHEGRCTELCESCGPGGVCEPAQVERFGRTLELHLCSLALARPDLELGPVTVAADGSEQVAIEIPDGLASFTIMLLDEAPEPRPRVGFVSLVAPDGTSLIDPAVEGASINPAAAPYPGACSVLVPSTDHSSAFPQPGTYLLRVGLFEISEGELVGVAGEVERVLVVLEPRHETGGLLDLNVFVSPATGVVAASAAETELIQSMLTQLQAYYLPGGAVRLGEVLYFDLPADHDTVETGDEARQICETYSLPGPRRVSVNVFLVASVAFAAGYTGGAPGPAGVFGRPSSGIVIARQDGGARTGTLLAHEIGHFLGLRHTTLFRYLEDGSYQVMGEDGISDTPSCTPGTTVSDCPDYRNLMFAFFPFDSLALTPQQLWVVASSPMLYEVPRPLACAASATTQDLTGLGFGAGDTEGQDDVMAGSCGGTGSPEQVFLYRLATPGLASLDVTVHAGEAPRAVYVRHGACDDPTAEIACAQGEAATDLVISVPEPDVGDYFIVVDGRDGAGGALSLDVSEAQASG